MNSLLAYLHGRFVPFAEALLALHDAGFVSGATIVDNARTFRHTLFRWPDHLARFRRDCEACYVPLVESDAELTTAAAALVAHNSKLLPPGGELQLVTFATPGPLGFYLGDSVNGPPTLGMATYPLPLARYQVFYAQGVALAVAGVQSMDEADILPPEVKHRSRLFWYVADRRVQLDHPGAIAVVLDAKGVADTAIGCLLQVRGDRILAAEEGSTQNSISLRVVQELCQQLGFRFERQELNWIDFTESAKGASEVLLAGTGFCLAGVRQWVEGPHSRALPGASGRVYQQLLGAWKQLAGMDFTRLTPT